jgi:hypothetical protein
MDIAERLLVLGHLLGFASLVGGWLVQARSPAPEVNAAMLHGAWIELVTGAGLVLLLVLGQGQPAWGQLSVKLGLTLLLVLLVFANRRFSSIPRGLWVLMGLMALINACVAVLWQ